MKIEISFYERNSDWEQFILESAKTASEVLTDDDFIERVGNWSGFDFTNQSPTQVANVLKNAGTVKINVGFYHRRLGPSIAKEVDGGVEFNTAKRARGAGSPGNLAHEVMHVLGFSHDGNRPGGNENTVPYRIGEWVDEALTGPRAQERE